MGQILGVNSCNAFREYIAATIGKPTGRMIFCEHGATPDAGVQRWQERLTPWWTAICGGCHLDRPIRSLIADAGFHVEGMQTMYLPDTPRFAGFNYWGNATKR